MLKIFRMLALLTHCNDARKLDQIHAQILTDGCFAIPAISNKLLNSYARFNALRLSQILFHQIKNPLTIHWNSIIKAFSHGPDALQAVKYYNRMASCHSSHPNSITFSSVLVACGRINAGNKCMEIHGSTIRSGFRSDVVVCTNLIWCYAAFGELGSMRKVFDEMTERNLVAWNSLISCYSQMGFHREALMLFDEMKSGGVGFDGFSLVGLLSACADVGALGVGVELHRLGREKGLMDNVYLGNALIDMYAKCGSLDEALLVFNGMKERDIFSWNSIIVGYGVHGFGDRAISLFKKMLPAGVKPDSITFLGLLCGCSHQGLVQNGVDYFETMSSEFGLKPDVKHYGCIVDLYGRAGKLSRALEVIESSPFSDSAVLWRTFLASSRMHKDVRNGEKALEKLKELGALKAGDCILVAGIYGEARDLKGVARMRRMIKYGGLTATPSSSWIEIDGRIRKFVANDASRLDFEEMYCRLQEMVREASVAESEFEQLQVGL
uniref:Pentatricopeptide repeat protein n=1 Tax=Salvia miltiorrhiza TaxID=226208 RepID=A0A678WDF3_SALMI|nr:pentatricopeptide repeat protein [Salvia miltiorrhiza]